MEAQGYQLRTQYASEGAAKRAQRTARVGEIEAELASLTAAVDSLRGPWWDM